VTVQTDKTLSDWSRAASALGPETSIRIIAAVSKAAHRIGASADTEGDAMPHVFLAVWRDGVSVDSAASQAVMSKHRTEQTRQADPDSVSLDDVETSAQRDALEAAIHAAGLGRDDVARSYGGGSRGEILPLTEALAAAPKGARAIVEACITEGAKHSATRDYSGALYVPLKVTVVALAAGVSRPRTKAASADLRAAACRAYGMVEALRDDSESVETLAASALSWVTRDRRAYGGNGQAVWQRGARPEAVPYALYRPLSDFQPDLSTGSHVAPLQPVRGHRVNTGSKGRKGPQAGQPSEDTSHGASAARTCGTLFSATGGPNDSGLTAKRSARSDEADLAAHEAQDSRAQGTACKAAHSHACYAVRVFEVSMSGAASEHEQGSPYSAACGCGPTNGQALILTGDKWTHALSVCPVPVVSESARVTCGCGRKRGALTAQGEHRAR